MANGDDALVATVSKLNLELGRVHGRHTHDPFGRVRGISKSSTDFEEDLGDVCLDLQNL